MNDITNWELLAKYISSECTTAEKEEVDSWINESENNRDIYNSAKKIWALPDEGFEPSDTKAIWDNIKSETGLNSNLNFENNTAKKDRLSIFQMIYRSPILKYAAVFIIVFSISLIYYLSTSAPTSQDYLTLKVEMGDQQTIVLSDGSKITLDAGSILKYPEKFDDKLREIELSGEAFFEVEHNKEKPFKVIAEHAVIEVLGTKFNIRTFNRNDIIKVFVAEGKVALSSKELQSQQQILTKGFFSSIDKTGKLSVPIKKNIESNISWLMGEKYFKNVSVTEVLSQIERWYDVQFKYDESELQNDELTLLVHKNSLTDMMEVISGLTSMEYQISGRIITLQ